MSNDEVIELIRQLRRFRTDHQHVEAKRSRQGLPTDLWHTLSAFANTNGGTLLLGVDEKANFEIVGVEDAAATMTSLQNLCEQMNPPLRTSIQIHELDERQVVSGEIPAVPRSQRPCHHSGKGLGAGAYFRSGDGNWKLTDFEIQEMTATSAVSFDHSARTIEGDVLLSTTSVTAFCNFVRERHPARAGDTDEQILNWYSAIDKAGKPTVAGILAMGDNPASVLPAARIAYRRLPNYGDPENARYAGDRFEGTIGELLDQTLGALTRDLTEFQVATDSGGLIDRPDVPREALREILSNAFLHRSLTDNQLSVSVAVEVSTDRIVITSPGTLHHTASVNTLGLMPISGVRNPALVRLCEHIRTPLDNRIIENQASGIAAAARASRALGAPPPLFIERAASFDVILFRRAPDIVKARYEFADIGIRKPDPDDVRILAWAHYVYELERGSAGSSLLDAALLDQFIAARLMAHSSVEAPHKRLISLTTQGLLIPRSRNGRIVWVPATAPVTHEVQRPSSHDRPRQTRRSRVHEVVEAVSLLGGSATRAEIGRHLNLSSASAVLRWIDESIVNGSIEPVDPGMSKNDLNYRYCLKTQRRNG